MSGKVFWSIEKVAKYYHAVESHYDAFAGTPWVKARCSAKTYRYEEGKAPPSHLAPCPKCFAEPIATLTAALEDVCKALERARDTYELGEFEFAIKWGVVKLSPLHELRAALAAAAPYRK